MTVIAIVTAILALSVFYLVVRIRDISAMVRGISDKIPASDEMRRQAADTIESINERIGSLNEKTLRLNDIMEEVTGLKNMFVMPKSAGAIGERLLEKVIYDVLPADMFEAQARLSAGTVDFAIRFRDFIVPIDSKLSLEDYNRMIASTDESSKRTSWKSFSAAVKKRIDETSKYILPAEGTTDFALMYIASEGVYYEAFVKSDQFGEENRLIEYAFRKKVYPTSPQTIYPYLMTILQGMKALKIEESAKDILSNVSGLRNDYERFKSIYNIIISHIENAHSKHNSEAHASLTRLEHHIAALEHSDRP